MGDFRNTLSIFPIIPCAVFDLVIIYGEPQSDFKQKLYWYTEEWAMFF